MHNPQTCPSTTRTSRMKMGHGEGGRPNSSSTWNVRKAYLYYSQPTSSFAAIPAHLYTPFNNFFRHLRHVVPKSVTTLFGSAMASGTTSAPPKTDNRDNRSLLKAAFLADGYRVAFLQAVIAILINHIRRMLVPSTGAFMFYNPMEDLRLARSNPEVFLEKTLSLPWTMAFLSYLQTYVLDLLALLAIHVLVANNGRLPRSTLDKFSGAPKAVLVTLEGLMHLCRIGYGVYLLIRLDYVFSQSAHAASCFFAIYKLTGAGEAGHLALRQVLLANWMKVPLHLWMLGYHIRYVLLPVLLGAMSSASRGRVGLLVTLMGVASGIWATLRWRARLYILLEMGPMFVVLGQVVAAAALLVRGWLLDMLRARKAVRRKSEGDVKESVRVGKELFAEEKIGNGNVTRTNNNQPIRTKRRRQGDLATKDGSGETGR
ncbi:hypothetical protein GE09DRAFT_19814 [Coniochaeta sp. 2T2.1]|nr:hypothetical protein GE09DRAFT_19814 [Coniochaeta sp. 2T2.1]